MDHKILGLGAALAFTAALVVGAVVFTLDGSTDTGPTPVARIEVEAARPVPVPLPPSARMPMTAASGFRARPEGQVTPRVPRVPRERPTAGEGKDRSARVTAVVARKIDQTQVVFGKVLSTFELSSSEEEEIRGLVDAMHADALDTLDAMRDGSLSSDEARSQLQDQRGQVDQDIAALLGSQRADDFLADVDTQLADARPAPGEHPRAGAARARRGGGRAGGAGVRAAP